MLHILGTLAVNYVFIQLAIIAFVLPFYGIYRYRNPAPDAVDGGFNRQLELFFESRQANWLVFVWAMGEAVVWFVIPEFLLLLLVFMRVKRKVQLLGYDIAGTAAGVVLAYAMPIPLGKVAHLPYITASMVEQTQVWYAHMGMWGLLHQPFSGVPFKVFNYAAVEAHYPLILFLGVAVIVRISRYLILYGLFVSLFPFLHTYVSRHYEWLMIIATMIFSGLLLKVYWAWSILRI